MSDIWIVTGEPTTIGLGVIAKWEIKLAKVVKFKIQLFIVKLTKVFNKLINRERLRLIIVETGEMFISVKFKIVNLLLCF